MYINEKCLMFLMLTSQRGKWGTSNCILKEWELEMPDKHMKIVSFTSNERNILRSSNF